MKWTIGWSVSRQAVSWRWHGWGLWMNCFKRKWNGYNELASLFKFCGKIIRLSEMKENQFLTIVQRNVTHINIFHINYIHSLAVALVSCCLFSSFVWRFCFVLFRSHRPSQWKWVIQLRCDGCWFCHQKPISWMNPKHGKKKTHFNKSLMLRDVSNDGHTKRKTMTTIMWIKRRSCVELRFRRRAILRFFALWSFGLTLTYIHIIVCYSFCLLRNWHGS